MRNDITEIDWTTPPRVFCQVRNHERARRLSRIRENTRRNTRTVTLQMIRRAAIPAGIRETAEDLALFLGVFAAPLIIMGLLFGPVIP